MRSVKMSSEELLKEIYGEQAGQAQFMIPRSVLLLMLDTAYLNGSIQGTKDMQQIVSKSLDESARDAKNGVKA